MPAKRAAATRKRKAESAEASGSGKRRVSSRRLPDPARQSPGEGDGEIDLSQVVGWAPSEPAPSDPELVVCCRPLNRLRANSQ